MLAIVYLVYLTLSVVGVLLEATLLPLPLGLVFVILGFVACDLKQGDLLRKTPRFLGFLPAAFLLGVLADILMLRPVGVTGLTYGVVVVLLRLYSRKFEIARLAYLLPFSGVVVGLYSWFFYLAWRQQVAIALAVVVVVRWVTGIGQRKYDRLRIVGS